MKLAAFGIIFALLIQAVSAGNSVIITEVLYDPVNSETGGEAVQLYNPTLSPIDIGTWSLATETSLEDATIPAGSVLLPNSYYLIADAGWSTLKDNTSYPAAEHEEAITLSNTDAGVALKNGTIIVDAVGWGAAANIDAGLFEGTPSNGTAQGKSLKRIFESSYIDTGNNAADFFPSAPFALLSTPETSQSLSVYAVIEGSAPIIVQIVLADEDSAEQGIQIYPLPKTNRQATITVAVSDTHADDIASVTAEFNSAIYSLNRTGANGTMATYAGYIEVPFYLAPSNYTVSVKAADLVGLESSANITFHYLSLTGIEFDAPSLVFNALPGSTVQLAGDSNFATQNLTIRNIGNSVLDFSISGTDLSSGNSKISVGSIAYTFSGNDYSALTAGVLSLAPQHEDVNLSPGEQALKGLSFTLTVPTTAMPGNYSGTIAITAEAS